MRPKSVTTLRRENPRKTIFSFMLAGPKQGGSAVLYEGGMPELTEEAAGDLLAEIRQALTKASGKMIKLNRSEPPMPGMTRIEK